jgi:hypothetical protein
MRKAFRRKIWGLSALGGCALGALVLLAVIGQRYASAYGKLGTQNSDTLARIVCDEGSEPGGNGASTGETCDLRAIAEDQDFEGADYVVSRHTRYFLYNSGRWPGLWLNRSDPDFIRKFRAPATVTLETGDQWRMYSEPADDGRRRVEILVASIVSLPWGLGAVSTGPELDHEMKDEVSRIAHDLRKGRTRSRADGWEVVDAVSGQVLRWSDSVPAYYPGDLRVRRLGVHVEDGQLWLMRSAWNDSLIAVSLESVGSLDALVAVGLGSFLAGILIAYPLAKRFGRTGVTHPVSLEEALRSGETGFVEFKQEVKDRQSLLKDLTAFANTNGGTLFIGVVDGTMALKGIDGASPERKDGFERGLRDSIRQCIQPSPEVVIDYPEKDGFIIARIFVRASSQRHSFEGRYYVREGTQSRYLVNGEIGHL